MDSSGARTRVRMCIKCGYYNSVYVEYAYVHILYLFQYFMIMYMCKSLFARATCKHFA